ncbi:MAG: carbon-nitrogen hydrolase family protein, partial [Planctomycetes bacterium]|nr:carbon-nitrogen hydrolase family protein [Planctomycetota bacterium]
MLKVAIAQIAPVFLDREATLAKVVGRVREAGQLGCRLVAFGETLVPAYPFWLGRTDGARFEDPDQKQLYSRYLDQAVALDRGHLDPVCEAARESATTVVLGVAERAADRGGHSIYGSRVVIDRDGRIASVHRKLMPTHEERLAWGIGDGAGLVTHRLDEFTLGALNCWENWMPLARAALYAGGEDLHVALWPGCLRLTGEITRFIALESRSYVVSASALIREQDLPADVPLRDRMVQPGETIYDGGSCIAGPDGQWVIEPVVGREKLLVAELDHEQVRRERQSFDP